MKQWEVQVSSSGHDMWTPTNNWKFYNYDVMVSVKFHQSHGLVNMTIDD